METRLWQTTDGTLHPSTDGDTGSHDRYNGLIRQFNTMLKNDKGSAGMTTNDQRLIDHHDEVSLSFVDVLLT